MQKTKPLVSVIMPSYNAEKYISESIRSVIAQTHTNWELLVIDDGSADRTAEIVREFAVTDSRITLYRNEKNFGVAMTRNRGLNLVKGEWIALLDSDDVWHSDKLEKQLSLAEATGADIIYCSYMLVDTQNRKLSEFIVPPETSYDDMLKVSVLSCSTVLMSKEIANKYRFTQEYYHEDYVFWLSLLRNGFKAAGCRDILADYRLQDGSRSHNKLQAAKNRWIIYRNSEKLPLLKAICSFVVYTYHGFIKHKRL